MTGTNEWLKVYTTDEKVYQKAFKRNETIYNKIPKEMYKDLNACIEYALKEGNHAAFVHYYLDVAKTLKELFCHRLTELVDKVEQETSWDGIQIISNAYWRSPDFEYIKDTVEKNAYGSLQLKNWKNGTSLPTKDAIVQIGLWYGFTSAEVDELLVLSGNERLYVLDVEDIIAMYYLDYYAQKKDSNITPFNKLKKVKELINTHIKEYEKREDIQKVAISKKNKVTLGEELTEEESNMLKEMGMEWQEEEKAFKLMKPDREKLDSIHMYYDKGKLYRYSRYNKLVYSKELDSWNIETEYNRLYKDYGLEHEVVYRQTDIEDGEEQKRRKLVTTQLEEKFRECETEEELENFIKEKKQAFALKRYGYLKLTMEYLKDIQAYKKNFLYTDYSLNLVKMVSKKEVLGKIDEFTESFLNKYCQDMYFGKKKEIKEFSYFKVFHSVWQLKNAMDINEYNVKSVDAKNPTDKNMISQLVYGRKEKVKFGSKKDENYYEYNLGTVRAEKSA